MQREKSGTKKRMPIILTGAESNSEGYYTDGYRSTAHLSGVGRPQFR